MPAGPGASHRSGKDSPPPARTQRDKRTAAASRPRAPRLAHLHCLTIPSSPAGDGLIAPQLSSAHARSRRPLLLPARPSPRPPGASWAEPAGSELSPLSLRPLLKRLARKLCACARQDAPTSATLSQSPGATLLGQVFGLRALRPRGLPPRAEGV